MLYDIPVQHCIGGVTQSLQGQIQVVKMFFLSIARERHGHERG